MSERSLTDGFVTQRGAYRYKSLMTMVANVRFDNKK
jgi:hypothetical protein